MHGDQGLLLEMLWVHKGCTQIVNLLLCLIHHTTFIYSKYLNWKLKLLYYIQYILNWNAKLNKRCENVLIYCFDRKFQITFVLPVRRKKRKMYECSSGTNMCTFDVLHVNTNQPRWGGLGRMFSSPAWASASWLSHTEHAHTHTNLFYVLTKSI